MHHVISSVVKVIDEVKIMSAETLMFTLSAEKRRVSKRNLAVLKKNWTGAHVLDAHEPVQTPKEVPKKS